MDRILWQKGPTSGLEQMAKSPWTLKSIARRSGTNSALSEGGGLLQTLGDCWLSELLSASVMNFPSRTVFISFQASPPQ